MTTDTIGMIIVILHNLRSAHNVGSIFRTADAAGVSRIFCIGTTPTPTDRFGRKQREIAKTALGAEDVVPWEHADTFEEVTARVQELGAKLIAVEQDTGAVSYVRYTPPERVAYIFGAEVGGVPREVLNSVETTIHIPLYGTKESLNVSVTAGVILFHALERQDINK